jgi:hypothetical protein
MKDWIILDGSIQSHLYLKKPNSILALFFADSEHFCAAGWADSLGSRLAVLHGDGFSIGDFFLGSALHTIRLHGSSFLVVIFY